MGYDCYLGTEGGSVRDRMTGEVIPLERRGPLLPLDDPAQTGPRSE